MPKFDLLLKGGHVIDPAQEIDGALDVALRQDKVAAVETDIDPSLATEVRDVTGLFVTSGLVDLHTHVYWGGTSLGIDAEAFCRKSAVTTAVDAGSAGPGNFAGFRTHVVEPSPVRILAYLHVSHAGIFAFSDRIMVGESENLRMMDPITAAEVATANRDVVVGIKTRLGRWASGDQGLVPFQYALQVAEEAGLPMMVHIDEPPPSYAELVDRLRPGDVLTHCFRPFPNTPLTGDGKIRSEVTAARGRGVLFDVGHGMGSFSFGVARAMLENGFPPDTISSDIHALCINGPAHDLVTTMSKFLNLGMAFADVVRATTHSASLALGRPDIGGLAPGAAADVALLSVDEGRFDYEDAQGTILTGDRKIAVQGVVVGGKWWDPT